jgi:hypothetical protein
MARISVSMDEIEGLVSVENTFWHGAPQSVLTILGVPVLFGPAHLTEDAGTEDELTEAFKLRLAGLLADLLLAQGGLNEWQKTPLHD